MWHEATVFVFKKKQQQQHQQNERKINKMCSLRAL